MGILTLVHIITADLPLLLKCSLRIVHFFGLALGLGSATLLDIYLFKFMIKGRITERVWTIFEFGTRIVNVGLVLLWASGLGFLAYYFAFDPAKLANPKIWAKLAIVAALTLNGAVLHWVVLPRVRQRIGRSLLDGIDRRHIGLFATTGALSAVSWYFPVLLGALSQLNGTVSAAAILGLYGIAFALAAATANLTLMTIAGRARTA
ncbi:MAG: hypothetical protein IBJ07_16850 [Rhizobiaceae bacterium]|nr:hypothetical protein [Rhizobiaceae bacterium]